MVSLYLSTLLHYDQKDVLCLSDLIIPKSLCFCKLSYPNIACLILQSMSYETSILHRLLTTLQYVHITTLWPFIYKYLLQMRPAQIYKMSSAVSDYRLQSLHCSWIAILVFFQMIPKWLVLCRIFNLFYQLFPREINQVFGDFE